MLEKNKTYTYEELKEIIIEAGAKVMQKLDEESKQLDSMGRMMFSMNNMMVISLFTGTLLKGEDNESNSD